MSSVSQSGEAYHIRAAMLDDVAFLPEIERSAGELFLSCEDSQLRLLASDEPTSALAHLESIRQWDEWNVGPGGTWVAVCKRDESPSVGEEVSNVSSLLVGFIKCRLINITGQQHGAVDQNVNLPDAGSCFIHIDELSVERDHQRRGLAKRLIDAVKEFMLRAQSPPQLEKTINEELDAVLPPKITGATLITMKDVPFNGPFYEKQGFTSFDPISEDRDIQNHFGEDGRSIWLEDKEMFKTKGDGSLAQRRCWMRSMSSQ